MRARLLIAFALGAALGGFVLFFATAQRELEFPRAVSGSETVRILVAKRELNYGMQIAPKDLRWAEWPKTAVPPGSFTTVEALLGKKGNEKRVVLRTIKPGEPVLEGELSKLGESPVMSFNLEQGKWAVAINVDASAGVGGFVAPGDRVDISLIRKTEGHVGISITMQDVPVIAVDDRPGAAREKRAFRTVIVEVDLQDAQKLILAQQVGRLVLTLRDVADPGIEPAPTMPRRLPRRPEGCRRPWSGYRDIPENILRPDLCRISLDGIIGPAFGVLDQNIHVRRRGDSGVPRGPCELPATAATGTTTMCDVMDFRPWAP